MWFDPHWSIRHWDLGIANLGWLREGALVNWVLSWSERQAQHEFPPLVDCWVGGTAQSAAVKRLMQWGEGIEHRLLSPTQAEQK